MIHHAQLRRYSATTHTHTHISLSFVYKVPTCTDYGRSFNIQPWWHSVPLPFAAATAATIDNTQFAIAIFIICIEQHFNCHIAFKNGHCHPTDRPTDVDAKFQMLLLRYLLLWLLFLYLTFLLLVWLLLPYVVFSFENTKNIVSHNFCSFFSSHSAAAAAAAACDNKIYREIFRKIVIGHAIQQINRDKTTNWEYKIINEANIRRQHTTTRWTKPKKKGKQKSCQMKYLCVIRNARVQCRVQCVWPHTIETRATQIYRNPFVGLS